MSSKHTSAKPFRWVVAGACAIALICVGLLATAARSQSTSAAIDTLTVLREGPPVRLPEAASRLASNGALTPHAMTVNAARRVDIAQERWAVAPSEDGGACLVAPDSTVACWDATAVMAGDARLMRLDVTGPDGKAAATSGGDVTGLVPDGVTRVHSKDPSGAVVATAPVHANTYRVAYRAGTTLAFVKTGE